MPPLYKQIRNKMVTGRLHKPSLEFCAQLQKIRYQLAGLRTPETRHNPLAFCIGNFKTGTMSVANLLGEHVRDKHEPHAYLFSKMWLRKETDQLNKQQWQEFLIRHSNALKLDYESSGFLTSEAPLLAKLFPNSKFILTIREPHVWALSMLQHIQRNRERLGCDYWRPVYQHYFRNEAFATEESELKELQLYPIASMLTYWRESNQLAIDSIPSDRLLILETKKLSESTEQLEDFLKLPQGSLSLSKSHANHWKDKPDNRFGLSQQYLESISQPDQDRYAHWHSDAPPNSSCSMQTM